MEAEKKQRQVRVHVRRPQRLGLRVVPEPEEVVQLRTENPALLQEVWEQKMEQVLILESAFLDNPNMMLAGRSLGSSGCTEAWQPNADETLADLQDAVDFVDIRDMLETWSAAVQSATKASLAKVAGDAALAFRREKLALREWSVSGAGDLAALQANWAEHLEAQRNIPRRSRAGQLDGGRRGPLF